MATRIKRLAHIVLFVADPDASAAWYAKILGMKVVTKVADGPYAGGVFLTFGEHDHDIALFRKPEGATTGKEFEHLSMELDCAGDLDRLRRFHGMLLDSKVRIAEILDHGVSVGIYFYDPDGHMLEVLCQMTPPEQDPIAQLARNGGQADPIVLEPLYD